MLTRRLRIALSLTPLGLILAWAEPARSQGGGPLPQPGVRGQTASSQPAAQADPRSEAEIALLRALASHPVTAPYPFQTGRRGDKVVLSGVVGTKYIHDVAIRVSIDAGIPIYDNLVINTAAVTRPIPATAPVARAPVPGMAPVGVPGTRVPISGVPPYVYPQPLFGYYDDPFYGFEPPVISYPPWWPALSARRLTETAAAVVAATPSPTPDQPAANQPLLEDGSVEMTIDPLGFAKLRGVVPDQRTKLAIGQRASRLPGVKGVINDLEIADPGLPVDNTQAPPPPPTPYRPTSDDVPQQPIPPPPQLEPPTVNAFNEEATAAQVPNEVAGVPPPIGVDDLTLEAGVSSALSRSPDLADLPIVTSIGNGVVTIRGHAPSAFEAMLAFRAVQSVPGVRRIVDQIDFPVPSPEDINPLLERGRSEYVEAYLAWHLAENLGEQVHIESVVLRDELLVLRGSISAESDRRRVMAILHSMPLLRGFQIEVHLVAR